MELLTLLPLLSLQGLPSVRVVDVIDILLVAFVVFQVYKLVRGTNAMRIFWAVVIIYLSWLVVSFFHMRLSSLILEQFVSIGLILMVIVFQPEIRRFLLLVGTKTSSLGENSHRRFSLFRRKKAEEEKINFDAYLQACMHMSASKTGALIIFARRNDIGDIVATGQRIDAPVNAPLLEALFFKNSPLHDGAVICRADQIVAARCILPVSSNLEIDPNLGLRHRSAIGMTEQTDAIAVIVSEETGAISYAADGEIHHNVTLVELQQYLEQNVR